MFTRYVGWPARLTALDSSCHHTVLTAGCCAGASQHALACETSDEVAEALLDINTLAPIRLTQAVLPHMIKRYVASTVAACRASLHALCVTAVSWAPNECIFPASSSKMLLWVGEVSACQCTHSLPITALCACGTNWAFLLRMCRLCSATHHRAWLAAGVALLLVT